MGKITVAENRRETLNDTFVFGRDRPQWNKGDLCTVMLIRKTKTDQTSIKSTKLQGSFQERDLKDTNSLI